MAKFSQKAQCEPWTGQGGPGGLRAKAGAGEQGARVWLPSTVLRDVGTRMGTDLPPRGSQPGPWEELGLEEHAVKRKERKGKQLHGVGMSFQAEVPRAGSSPAWEQRVRVGARPVETSRPKGFSWEVAPWLRLLNHL